MSLQFYNIALIVKIFCPKYTYSKNCPETRAKMEIV